jgi:hypothetical protein
MNILKGVMTGAIILPAMTGCDRNSDDWVKTAKGDRVKKGDAAASGSVREPSEETDQASRNEDDRQYGFSGFIRSEVSAATMEFNGYGQIRHEKQA